MKYFVTFVVGAVVGATVSYFITRHVERKNADDQIAAVTDKMREIKGFVKETDDIPVVNLKTPDDVKEYDEPTTPIITLSEIDYSAISNAKKPAKKINKASYDILQVDEQKYYDYINNKSYGEFAFTFYQGDGVLVNEETGNRVLDPEKYVGPNGVDAMRKVSVEEVYYVDERDEIINCITISEDTYYEEEPEDDNL